MALRLRQPDETERARRPGLIRCRTDIMSGCRVDAAAAQSHEFSTTGVLAPALAELRTRRSLRLETLETSILRLLN